MAEGQRPKRNGKLAIPLPFDEALKKALKAEPSPARPKAAPGRKRAPKR